MRDILETFKDIKSISDAIKLLGTLIEITPPIQKALDFAIKAHSGQFRKSGEPYVIHPIVVAAIVAVISGDEEMVIAALLHDVVEDTSYEIEDIQREFGDNVKELVEGLTKIVEIRDKKLIPSTSNEKLITSALSFRKMLIASIKNVKVLVIKLCDRLHNMLTLDALPPAKRLRISEETLVVYVPIAHRLGIGKIKNLLEDLSFKYIYPEDYKRIDDYMKEHHQSLQLKLNDFIEKVKQLLNKSGFHRDDFEIIGRVKHYYSIYLKMHRKGVSIDEILDLLAIRIIVNEPIECYEVLGYLHLNFTPLVSRFKDYIALPKDNGYQTIHTTIFDDKNIFEAQIRTKKMHHLAEFGIAAHWKYKGIIGNINLDWLKSLPYQDRSIEHFYERAKESLYSEDIVVLSPKGEHITLPRGSVALDFAYAIHSEIGDRATAAYVNKEKVSLLTILKNGDIVKIETQDKPRLHCSWVDVVKTTKAKEGIKHRCRQYLRELNYKIAVNILATIFDKSPKEIIKVARESKLVANLSKASTNLDTLKEKIYKVSKYAKIREVRFWELLKKGYKKPYLKEIDLFRFFTNKPIEKVEFDYCCHPKIGDEIVAFYKDGVAIIHHKLCRQAIDKIDKELPMVYVEWKSKKTQKYKLLVGLQNKKGVLAKLLQMLANMDINVIGIELGLKSGENAEYCEIYIEGNDIDRDKLKEGLSKSYKVVEITPLDDAY
ncbi:MAG: RelA/SpoT family protein, partial [Epsilonproteobacteria bacterium]|nr:RelA/SpoT family protein [Campylobacterota bacterium]